MRAAKLAIGNVLFACAFVPLFLLWGIAYTAEGLLGAAIDWLHKHWPEG